MISVIVPILNEAALVPALARRLEMLSAQGLEVLVVDGGSADGGAARLAEQGLRVLSSAPGRARQMNRGAAVARGDILLLLHADTELPNHAAARIEAALRDGRHHWGRFDLRIAGRSRWLPMIAFMVNWRSRLTAIATGDQAMFVRASVFAEIGGFAEQPLMEDIELCRRLRQAAGRPLCLRRKVVTSGRRWDQNGTWATIFMMWRLRWAYWRGVSAQRLAERYR